MEENICPICGNIMFDVYFNDDSRYTTVQYKRCMHCDSLIPYATQGNNKD